MQKSYSCRGVITTKVLSLQQRSRNYGSCGGVSYKGVATAKVLTMEVLITEVL
jgi:hypothetical protein